MLRGQITLVCGPPGSGKSTYVSDHASLGDLIVDVDLLWKALAGMAWRERPFHLLHYVLAARDGVVRELQSTTRSNPTAWVIGCLPKKKERMELARQLSATVVMLDVPKLECLRRIKGDSRKGPQAWEQLIAEWWETYER